MYETLLTRRETLKYIGCFAGIGALYSSLPAVAGVPVPARDRLADFLEEATLEQVLEGTIQQIKQGLTHTDLLAALTRVAVRNVQPWPDVGYKYHNVMVLQSLYLTAQTLPPWERWFPLIWQVDYFKRSQAAEKRQTGWRMQPVQAGRINARQAEKLLLAALQNWDREAADVAVTQLLAAGDATQTMQLLLPHFLRDYRELGHKPITGANALRMLRYTNGYAAEELLRSAVAAMQNPGRHANPAVGDYLADRAWRQNVEIMDQIPQRWQQGKTDREAGRTMLQTMRNASDLEAAREAVRLLQEGVAPQVIWEALLGAAAEVMLRTGSFAALHANTMANSAYYLYRQASEDKARRLLLLQTASLLALFRDNSGRVRREITLDTLEPLDCGQVEECFAMLRESRYRAVRMALGYLQSGGSEAALIDAVRHYTVYYTGNSHDYKYTEAILEDYRFMSAPWRHQYLSSVMLWANGPHQQRNPVIETAQTML